MRTDYSSHVSPSSIYKLNSFRYVQNEKNAAIGISSTAKYYNHTHHPDKENQTSWINKVVENKTPSKSQPSTGKHDVMPVKYCPQTPANRIPLADLISNTEDAFKFAPGNEATPEDYVYWQHVPRSSDPNSGTPIARGKKRRNSSSPTSSPLQASNRKEAFDMQKSQSLLKTPQTDMVTDLWKNYIGKTMDETNGEIPQRLANLLSSSPKTPGSAKSNRESNLRRAASCGIDWPTSNTKRRKISHLDDGRLNRDPLDRSKSDVPEPRIPHTSKLSILLDKIQENLKKNRTIRSDIATDSLIGSNINVSARNLEKERCHEGFNELDNDCACHGNNSQLRSMDGNRTAKSFSEFGDDDLDEDLLQLVEHPAPLNAPTEQYVSLAEPRISQERIENRPPFGYIAQTRDGKMGSQSNELENDEFDEDDDFAKSIEEIMLRYDHQESVSAQHTVPNWFKRDDKTGGNSNVPADSHTRSFLKTSAGGKATDLILSDEFDDEELELAAIGGSALQCGTNSVDEVGHP